MSSLPKIAAADLPRVLGGVVAEVVAMLESRNVGHALIGGLAVGVHTQARATKDVDFAVVADEPTATSVVDGMRALGFAAKVHGRVGPGAVARFSRTDPDGIERWVDFLFAGTPFEENAVARATTLRVLGGAVAVVSVEDLLVYKLLAGRPQDVADAVALMRAHRADLDSEYLDTASASWQLEAELARVRDLAARA